MLATLTCTELGPIGPCSLSTAGAIAAMFLLSWRRIATPAIQSDIVMVSPYVLMVIIIMLVSARDYHPASEHFTSVVLCAGFGFGFSMWGVRDIIPAYRVSGTIMSVVFFTVIVLLWDALASSLWPRDVVHLPSLIGGVVWIVVAYRRNRSGAQQWRRMHMPYACLACGYDLRGSATRCPECGTVVPPPNEGSASFSR